MSAPIFAIESLERRHLTSMLGLGFPAIQNISSAKTSAAPAAHKAQVAVHKSVRHPGPMPPVTGNWKMIFDDEFNSSTLNRIWHTAQTWDNTVSVIGQTELEAYAASAVSVSGGDLHLTARADDRFGVPYVSGLVTTGGEQYNADYPKFSFQYGYMQVSAKIPAGQGLFPAIWMLPASYQDQNGEIDVMEVLDGHPGKVYFTVHRSGQQEQHTLLGANLSAGFHTYGVDWEPNKITWYLDGIAVATCTNPSLIPQVPMYPIMNLAVGGWGGPPNAATKFPSSMAINYIRIWQDTPES